MKHALTTLSLFYTVTIWKCQLQCDASWPCRSDIFKHFVLYFKYFKYILMPEPSILFLKYILNYILCTSSQNVDVDWLFEVNVFQNSKLRQRSLGEVTQTHSRSIPTEWSAGGAQGDHVNDMTICQVHDHNIINALCRHLLNNRQRHAVAVLLCNETTDRDML